MHYIPFTDKYTYIIFLIVEAKRVDPDYIHAHIGDTVSFKCDSNVHVTWYFKMQKIPNNAFQYSLLKNGEYYLKVVNIQAKNAGLYECHGETSPNNYFYSDGLLDVVSEFIILFNLGYYSIPKLEFIEAIKTDDKCYS